VANSFVALISPRAHRAGLSIDEAIRKLMEQVDSAYDRRVVAALVSYIDNKGGREVWELVSIPQAAEPAPPEQPDEDNPWQR